MSADIPHGFYPVFLDVALDFHCVQGFTVKAVFQKYLVYFFSFKVIETKKAKEEEKGIWNP